MSTLTSHSRLKISLTKTSRSPKFIVVCTADDIILFKDICVKAEKHFFENENCNYYVEELHECITSINGITNIR